MGEQNTIEQCQNFFKKWEICDIFFEHIFTPNLSFSKLVCLLDYVNFGGIIKSLSREWDRKMLFKYVKEF